MQSRLKFLFKQTDFGGPKLHFSVSLKHKNSSLSLVQFAFGKTIVAGAWDEFSKVFFNAVNWEDDQTGF